MKRLVYLLIAVSLMLALVPAVASAEETTVDLMAGQHTDVGYVLVWNDADYLYVKYVVDVEGWCLTETHLQVATSLEDGIPQKNGNPIPGKFEDSSEYALDPCEQEPDPYMISLDTWGAGTPLYIAAHAVVVQPIDGCSETVWQIGDVEVVNASEGWLENYADEFNWGEPAGPTTAGPSLTEQQPAFTDPFMVGTTPTEEFPFNSNYNRGYATDFDVQWDGGLPFGGKLTISWSPGQSATEKKEVVSDGFPTATFIETGTPSPGQDWFLDTYPLVQHSVAVNSLPMGTHTINFQHTQGDGTYWDWIRLEKPCEETAWGAGEDFPGKNWAMYFDYTVQPTCPEIESYSGPIDVLSTPPESVAKDGLTSGEYVRVFEEFAGSVAGLTLDIPGTSYTGAVCSYYIHVDMGSSSSGDLRAEGSLTFDDNVVGLIIRGSSVGSYSGNTLCETNGVLGADGTDYDPANCGADNDQRGLEIGVDNLYPPEGTNDGVQIDGDTVNFSLRVVPEYHDAFRIILPYD